MPKTVKNRFSTPPTIVTVIGIHLNVTLYNSSVSMYTVSDSFLYFVNNTDYGSIGYKYQKQYVLSTISHDL